MFTLDGVEYSLQDLQKAAIRYEMKFDAYLDVMRGKGLTEVQEKETPKKKVDPVAVDQATVSKEVTGSNLENTSLESQEVLPPFKINDKVVTEEEFNNFNKLSTGFIPQDQKKIDDAVDPFVAAFEARSRSAGSKYAASDIEDLGEKIKSSKKLQKQEDLKSDKVVGLDLKVTPEMEAMDDAFEIGGTPDLSTAYQIKDGGRLALTGRKSYAENNFIDGTSYEPEVDGELNTYASENPEAEIVVFGEQNQDAYNNSTEYIKSLEYELEKTAESYNNPDIDKKEKYSLQKEYNQLQNLIPDLKERHQEIFGTFQDNVNFVSTQQLVDKRNKQSGLEVQKEDVEKYGSEKAAVEKVVYRGKIYLGPEGDKKRGFDPLFDEVSGRNYSLEEAPKEFVKRVEEAKTVAATTTKSNIEKGLTESSSRLVGGIKDLGRMLATTNQLNKEDGLDDKSKTNFMSAFYAIKDNKKYQEVFKYVNKYNELPPDLSTLNNLFKEQSDLTGTQGFSQFSESLGGTFNEELQKYLVLNRAYHTNENIMSSEDKNIGEEFLDSALNIFGGDIQTDNEEQAILNKAFKDTGRFDDKFLETYRDKNEITNIQAIARGVPELTEFVVELAVMRKVSGNVIAKSGRALQALGTRYFRPGAKLANQFAYKGINNIMPILVEGAEFGALTGAKNFITGEDESVSESFISGGALGASGKIGRAIFGGLEKGFLRSSNFLGVRDYGKVGFKNLRKGFYESMRDAAGGSVAVVGSGILMNPIDYEYNKMGDTAIQEYWKMWFLGKLRNGMKTPGGSIKNLYEKGRSDILDFSYLTTRSSNAAKVLDRSTENISTPDKNSNRDTDKAYKNKAQIVKNDKTITAEQRREKLKQLRGAKKTIDVQVGVNQAKANIKADIKAGRTVSAGRQYQVGQKIKSGESLTEEEGKNLSNMSPEGLLVNSGMPLNAENRTAAKATIDNETRIQRQLNGGGLYVVEGGFETTGGREGEYKALTPTARKNNYDFLVKQAEASNQLYRLKQIARKGMTPLQLKQLDTELEVAEKNFKNYTEGGKAYEQLQENISAEAKIQYNKAISKTGKTSIIEASTPEEFKKMLGNVDGAEENIAANLEDGTSVVNKELALKVRNMDFEVHEGTHLILKDSFKDSDGNVTDQGVDVIDNILTSLTPIERKLLDEQVRDRYTDPKTGKLPPKKEWYEENLTILSELMKQGKVGKKGADKFIESLKGIGKILKNKAFPNLEINEKTGEGMFEMLKGFAENTKKGNKQADAFANKAAAEKQAEGKPSGSGKIDASKSVIDLNRELESLKEIENELDQGDFQAQESNLKLKIALLEAKEAKEKEKGVSKPVKKTSIDQEIENSANEVFKEEVVDPKKPTAISKKNLEIADRNTKIENKILDLGANRLSDIKNEKLRKKISDALIKNNMGAVGELAKKSAFVGKSLNISEGAKVSYEDFLAGYNEQLIKLANSYKVEVENKEGGIDKIPFGAYAKTNLRLRYGDILKEAIKGKLENTSSMSDSRVQEAAESITDTDGVETTSKPIVETKLTDVRKAPIVVRKNEDGAIDKAVDLEGVDIESLNYKDTAEMFMDKMAQALLGISGDKASGKVTITSKKAGEIDNGAVTAMQDLFRSKQDVKSFLRVLPEFNVAPNQTTVNLRGESVDVSRDKKGVAIGLNKKIKNILYEKYIDPNSTKDKSNSITDPKGRSKGKTSQTSVVRLKPEYRNNISPEVINDFMAKLGLTPKGEARIPISGTARSEFGTVLQGATKIYLSNLINTVARENIVKRVEDNKDSASTPEESVKLTNNTNQTLAGIGAGKSKLMFSKQAIMLQSGGIKGLVDSLVKGTKSKEFERMFVKNVNNKEVDKPLYDSLMEYFQKNPIKKVSNSQLKKISAELSGDYTFGNISEVGIERVLKRDGVVKTLKYILENTEEGLIRGNSYDTVQLINQFVAEQLDTTTLEGINEGREATEKAVSILVTKGFTGNEIKNILSAMYGPSGIGGFKGKLDKLGTGRAVPKGIILTEKDLGSININSKGKRENRGAFMISEADLVQNFLKGVEMGPSVSTRSDAFKKDFWVKSTSTYNKLKTNKAKKEYLQKLQKAKTGYSDSLITFIESIGEAGLSPAAQRNFIRLPFAAMDGLGKITSAPRWMPALMDGTLLSHNDMIKLGFGRKDGKVDEGVFEHTKPANRMAIAAYVYSLTGKKADLKILKDELIDYDTAFITKGMDMDLTKNKLQSLMGLDYVRGQGVMGTRYMEMITDMAKKGVTFYDAKNNTLIDPSTVFSEVANVEKINEKVVAEEVKLVDGKIEASESNNNEAPKIIRYSKPISNQQSIEMLAKTDKALENGRKINAPVKRLEVDFDALDLFNDEAKAGWMLGKAAEGYNDFYFANKAMANNAAVKKVMSVLDVKSKTQQAKVKFSKGLDREFNEIIENKTGIAAEKNYAKVKASLVGKSKGRLNFFIPPSAEDFVGLLYSTLGKGKVGDSQMQWYKDSLLSPYARAMENITRDGNTLGSNFRALKKELKVIPKDLKKKIKGEVFTKEQAVRVYIWDQAGKEIPGISKADRKELTEMVESDAKLKVFAQEIMKLGKGREYLQPTETWTTGTITTDLIGSLNTTGRKQYLEQWQQNADIIFSEKNLNKLEAAYGGSYRKAMENILKRMKTGRNKTFNADSLTGRFTDWINGSTAAIMFFNTRSAALQTISAANFINFGDNNILAAGKAFANQPQYWKDFKKLYNSDFLTSRRDGLKININEADIADAAKENGARGVINKLLKLGFTPTQMADSFAIASGGASFYRNRLKSLIKEGMDPVAAEQQAMRDFRETAEESQQSSRADRVSSQQAGELGRIVLAFANTPSQYARLMKKAASDLKNGRGDAKANVSKIMYYGVAQNLLFNSLQQALFAVSFGDEEEKEELDDKQFRIINGMVDSVARGTGLGGAVFTVIKNAGIKIYDQSQKKNPKYEDAALELLKISPPISSKVQKVRSAGRSASWNMDDIKEKGFGLDNPAYLATGNVVSAATNVPLDRLIKKVNNLVAASDSEIETYKRFALIAGWSEWELGLTDKKKPKKKEDKKKKKKKRGGGSGFGGSGF